MRLCRVLLLQRLATRSPNPNPTLTLTFDLIFIGGLGIMMDYPCAKFGDFSFSRFGCIMRQKEFTEADDRYAYHLPLA